MDTKTLYRLKAAIRRGEKNACLRKPPNPKLLAEISDIGARLAKAQRHGVDVIFPAKVGGL